ncbi:MAG TPA: hypothetical protein ENL03_06390, partial [Phycisphaerae bacterium]|nr:hypothetical protein [Phycisphaerae bacterium]
MRNLTIRKAAAIVIALAVFSAASREGASQGGLHKLSQDAESIKTVLKVKIVDVKRIETRMKLANGKEGPVIRTTMVYTGNVVEVVVGKWQGAKENVTLTHTMPVGVKYDKSGKVKFTCSFMLPGSGLEHHLKKDSVYLLCFASQPAAGKPACILRAEPLTRHKAVLQAIEFAAAKARADIIRANIDRFEISLTYFGEQDKPYSNLTLRTGQLAKVQAKPFFSQHRIDKVLAGKIIDHLLASGFFNSPKKRDLGKGKAIANPTGSAYRIEVSNSAKKVAFFSDVWEKSLLECLDGLAGVIDEFECFEGKTCPSCKVPVTKATRICPSCKSKLPRPAHDAMSKLVARLSGHRKQWTKVDEVARLIKELGDDNWTVRDAASLKLKEMGEKIHPQLKAARKQKD